MRTRPIYTLPVIIMLLGCLEVEASEELNPLVIDEWDVPYAGRPRDPYVSNNDEVWFVGQSGHYLGRFTPSSGRFFKRALEDRPGPHNVIVGTDGIVWYTGNMRGYIGRYDPLADKITRIFMPDEAAHDPHTMAFSADEKYIWFTVQRGNFVGRLTIDDLSIELIKVTTPHALPYGIRLAPDGTPWIALLGTNKLAAVNPSTLNLKEYTLLHPDARPRRLEITRDSRIWYADYRRGTIGLYNPATNTNKEWPLSAGRRSEPYGTALDKQGRLWVVETGVTPNIFVGFDTRSEEIVSVTHIPSGAGSVRNMYYHAPTDSVWFGTDAGTLGRAPVAKTKQN